MAIEQTQPNYFSDIVNLRNPEEVVARVKEIDLKVQSGQRDEIEFSRDLFAETRSGERYFEWIVNGSPCEFRLDTGSEMCGKPSIVALEFDAPPHLDVEVALVCSIDHMEQTRQLIVDSLLSQNGRSTVFGINGWGRTPSRHGE